MYNIISVSSPRANNFGGGHCCILSWAVAVLIGWPRIKLEVNEIKKKISPGSNKLKFPFENGSWSLNRHYSGNKHYVQLIGNSKIKKKDTMKRNPQPLPLLPITWLTWPGRTPSWALNQDDCKCIMFFFFFKLNIISYRSFCSLHSNLLALHGYLSYLVIFTKKKKVTIKILLYWCDYISRIHFWNCHFWLEDYIHL